MASRTLDLASPVRPDLPPIGDVERALAHYGPAALQALAEDLVRSAAAEDLERAGRAAARFLELTGRLAGVEWDLELRLALLGR